MLQLERSKSRLAVAGAAQWRFPRPDGSGLDPAQRRELVARAVREILGAGRFRTRDAVSCIRAEDMSVKNVRLPQMSDADLARAVTWECQERFGFDVTADRVHYIKAGEVRQGTETRDEVILMAVTEETIAEHLGMLDQMHLCPVHVDAEPTALFRTYQRFLRRARDGSAATVLVDIGRKVTKVIVARGPTIVLIKTIDLAGEQFTEAVASELGLSHEEARQFRRRAFEDRSLEPSGDPAPGDQVQWSVLDAVRGQAEALAREIGLCLRYCAVTFRGLRPAQITLTGGEAYDPALVKLLNNSLDYDCVVGEPLRGLDLGGADLGSDRRGVMTEWSVATGLALRGLFGDRATRKSDCEDQRRRVPA